MFSIVPKFTSVLPLFDLVVDFRAVHCKWLMLPGLLAEKVSKAHYWVDNCGTMSDSIY